MPAPLQYNNDQEALLHSVIARLQEPPFSLSLPGGVNDLATNPPHSLLQLLYHVLSYLEPRMAFDIKNVPEDERVARTLDFLGMLNCPLLGSDDAREEDEEAMLAQGVKEGDKTILLPLLAWCLDNLPYLHRRAYLGRYLMPVDLPSDHLLLQEQDPTLTDLHDRLQAEFMSTHKAFEEAQAALGPTNKPREIRAEIKQLEEEKHQLEEKIGRMAKVGQKEVGFNEMLSLTRAIREEEEEEGLLNEKLVEERQALEVAGRRVRALNLMVEEEEGRRRGGRKGGRMRTRTSEVRDGATAEGVVEELQEEVRRLQYQVTEKLPSEMEKSQLRLGREGGRHGNRQEQQQQQQQQQQQVKVGREDVEALLYEVKRAELHVQYWKAKIEEKIISAGMANPTSTTKRREGGKEGGKEGGREGDRFLSLREHALVAAMARRGKEEELKVLLREKQQQQFGGARREGGGGGAAAAAMARRQQEEEIERLCVKRRVLDETKERLQSRVSDWADFGLFQKAGVAAAGAASAAGAAVAAPGGMTSRSRTGIAGSAGGGGGGGGRSTESELKEALRQINKEIKMEKIRLQPLVKVLKEGRREEGVLEEERRLHKAQYERVMMTRGRKGGKEDRKGEREGGKEMLALKALLEVKLRVCEEGRRE